MKRSKLLPLGLAFFLAACSGGSGSSSVNTTTAFQMAEQVREGCVATTLDVMQDVVDVLSPLAGIRTVAALETLAFEAGCNILLAPPGETEHTVFCANVTVRGEPVTVVTYLTYVRNGVPTAAPDDADLLRVIIHAQGQLFLVVGQLELRVDPLLGITVDGTLSGDYDGCAIEGSLDGVTIRTIADAAGAGYTAIFASGNVDLGIEASDGALVNGTAALVGRHALVALEVDGVFSQGEIALD